MFYLDDNDSIYDLDDDFFSMVVTDYDFDGDKVTLNLHGKEDLVGTYYVSSYDELVLLKDNLKYGIKVYLWGSLSIPSKNTIPHTFNYQEYLKNMNIYYILKIDKIEIVSDDNVNFVFFMKNILNKRINRIDNSGYMKAFILGDKSLINKDVYSNYQKIGVTHLFALSGMHVGLLSAILLKILGKIKEYKRYLIVDLLLIIYGFIVGFPSSIKRCITFYVFNSFNKIFKLDISPLKILFWTVAFLIFLDYKIIFDVGFRYSVATVGGILFSNNFINDQSKVKSAFKLSLIAFLFSMPISLMSFYEVNFLSIIFNIIYVPYVSIIVYPLSLLSFFIPWLYDLFMIAIDVLESFSLWLSGIDILSFCLGISFFEVTMFYLILLLVFYKNYYVFLIFYIIGFVIIIIKPYFDSSAYVYYFDVGQGDCSLVISPFRKEVIMIDTGGKVKYKTQEWKEKSEYLVTDNIIDFMKYLGIRKIDLLVLSHGDFDHMGEALNVVRKIKVKNVLFNYGDYNQLESNLILELNKDNVFFIHSDEFNDKVSRFFKILNGNFFNNENDDSVVLYFDFYDSTFLFMGDAGIKRELDLLDKYDIRNVDFIKVGHHGSDTSSSFSFIDYIKPRNCILSVGKNNRYGHPKENVIDILDDYCDIYRTDLNGSIEVKLNRKGYKIKTYSP